MCRAQHAGKKVLRTFFAEKLDSPFGFVCGKDCSFCKVERDCFLQVGLVGIRTYTCTQGLFVLTVSTSFWDHANI